MRVWDLDLAECSSLDTLKYAKPWAWGSSPPGVPEANFGRLGEARVVLVRAPGIPAWLSWYRSQGEGLWAVPAGVGVELVGSRPG